MLFFKPKTADHTIFLGTEIHQSRYFCECADSFMSYRWGTTDLVHMAKQLNAAYNNLTTVMGPRIWT